MKMFVLLREEDETGVSGTGRIAEGVQFWDGTCVMRWRTDVRSTALYNSVAELMSIHGHGGKTRIEFSDEIPV